MMIKLFRCNKKIRELRYRIFLETLRIRNEKADAEQENPAHKAGITYLNAILSTYNRISQWIDELYGSD